MGMRMRLLLAALMAFASVSPAAAQVRVVVPGSVSVVPSFAPALAPGLASSFSAPALSFRSRRASRLRRWHPRCMRRFPRSPPR